MKKFLVPLVFVSLFSLTGCWGGDTEPSAPAPASTTTTAPAQTKATSPSIDDQIQDLKTNNGSVPQDKLDKLNKVPVVPDVFGK